MNKNESALSRMNAVIRTQRGTVRLSMEKIIKELIIEGRNKVYPLWTHGLNQTKPNNNYYQFLDCLNIEYTKGNEDKRGRHIGTYIKLTKKGRQEIKQYREINPKLLV